uniref:Uncharacterized protein n=1 Tax=Oryza punctata TaxID=4537 RepID=A0A0E0JUN0_ORYPU
MASPRRRRAEEERHDCCDWTVGATCHRASRVAQQATPSVAVQLYIGRPIFGLQNAHPASRVSRISIKATRNQATPRSPPQPPPPLHSPQLRLGSFHGEAREITVVAAKISSIPNPSKIPRCAPEMRLMEIRGLKRHIRGI